MRIPEPWVQGTGGQSGGIDDRLERWRLRFGRDTGIDRMADRAMLLGKRQPLPLGRRFEPIASLRRPGLSGRDCSADNRDGDQDSRYSLQTHREFQ